MVGHAGDDKPEEAGVQDRRANGKPGRLVSQKDSCKETGQPAPAQKHAVVGFGAFCVLVRVYRQQGASDGDTSKEVRLMINGIRYASVSRKECINRQGNCSQNMSHVSKGRVDVEASPF